MALCMGLDPDKTLAEDLYLVSMVVDENGRKIGIEPSEAVKNHYKLCRNKLELLSRNKK